MSAPSGPERTWERVHLRQALQHLLLLCHRVIHQAIGKFLLRLGDAITPGPKKSRQVLLQVVIPLEQTKADWSYRARARGVGLGWMCVRAVLKGGGGGGRKERGL